MKPRNPKSVFPADLVLHATLDFLREDDTKSTLMVLFIVDLHLRETNGKVVLFFLLFFFPVKKVLPSQACEVTRTFLFETELTLASLSIKRIFPFPSCGERYIRNLQKKKQEPSPPI